MISETDKAWAAGYFDGEGTVGIYTFDKEHNSYRANCSIGSTVVEPLLKIQSLWGGTVYKESYQLRKGYKQFYRWQLSKVEEMDKFLRDIHFYLLVKKSEMDIMFEYFKTHQKRGEDIKQYRAQLKEKLFKIRHIV